MQGMAAVQVPDAGPEQGLLSVGAPASGIELALAFPAVKSAMSGMRAMGPDASALIAPAMGCIPGTTHTTPPVTILR